MQIKLHKKKEHEKSQGVDEEESLESVEQESSQELDSGDDYEENNM